MDPVVFDVPLVDGWFSFRDTPELRFWTRYPIVELALFDAEAEEFIPIFHSGGLQVNFALHPWIIIRARTLKDRECKDLDSRIRRLMDARAGAQQLLAGYKSIFALRGKSGNGGIGGGHTNVEHGVRVGIARSNSVAETEQIGSDGALRAGTTSTMVIDIDEFFGSDGSGSTEGEMEMDELEEDEGDATAEAMVARDLTNVASMSTGDLTSNND